MMAYVAYRWVSISSVLDPLSPQGQPVKDMEKVVCDGAQKLLTEGAFHVLKHVELDCELSITYWRDSASFTVAPAGTTGATLLLGGGMNSVVERFE